MSNFAFTNYAMLEKYVLIFLLLGSQHAVAAQHLHYNVSATPNFVLGMYFEKTSYLCLSPVTPQAELKCRWLPLQILKIGMLSTFQKSIHLGHFH